MFTMEKKKKTRKQSKQHARASHDTLTTRRINITVVLYDISMTLFVRTRPLHRVSHGHFLDAYISIFSYVGFKTPYIFYFF